MNATLKVGTTNQTVEIVGTADTIAPVDSGEKSSVLTTKELENYFRWEATPPSTSRSCRASASRTARRTRQTILARRIGINANGDAGSQSPLNNAYSYNGLPSNSLDITADGAHVSDPGCNCDTPVNPNSELLQEFKVLTSNFSAENQKGPIVITSVTKSGRHSFHGSAASSLPVTTH